MTYVFALAALQGRDGAADLVDHGLAALSGPLPDAEYGGWHPVDPRGAQVDEKRAYDHAFVVLAAAAATVAGRPGAAELLTQALEVVDRHFWVPEDGLAVDVWDRGFTRCEPYRGANANMHLVEAYLTAATATGDRRYVERALGIAEKLVHGHARAFGWRMPEHYDAAWQVLPDYNRDRPDDPFRPFGATVGHWLEWSRLLLHLHLACAETSDAPPDWLLADARGLHDTAVAEGWTADGAEGFVYTVDFDGRPVVRTRMHWVVCEALAASATVTHVTGDPWTASLRDRWWDYARRHLVDRAAGGWHHELDPHNRPAATVWAGKPDVYHAYQALLVCLLPAAPSVPAAVLARG